jgi:hypothetical protein
MATKIEDTDLKKIFAFVELAQKTLNVSDNEYLISINKLGQSPPNDVAANHGANLIAIKKKYAKLITQVCSNIIND